MIDRIRELLSARQLTPTQFADTIGVARPIISHILSGRNKPSLDVVQKIVDTFPDVSLTWLLKGIGGMTAAEIAPAPVTPASVSLTTAKRTSPKASETARPAPNREQRVRQPAPSVIAPTSIAYEGNSAEGLHDEASSSAPVPTTQSDAVIAPEPTKPAPVAPVAVAPIAPTLTASNFSAVNSGTEIPESGKAKPGRETEPDSNMPPAAQPFLQADKVIRRIVIFYQDGTFTDYQPEKA